MAERDDAPSEDEWFDSVLRDLASAPALPLKDPLLGQVLGPYRVVARVGIGANGSVYRARDERLGRDVALKVLPASDEMLHEARCVAQTAHPNIAQIYDVGSTEVSSIERGSSEHGSSEGGSSGQASSERGSSEHGSSEHGSSEHGSSEHGSSEHGSSERGSSEHVDWIAFELIEGKTLAELVAGGGNSDEYASALALGLAKALQHLHERGLVHGDLSPRNVLWRRGEPVLIDFGLSSAAGVPRAAGTSGFVAPEVLSGAARDFRSDVFAFGALLLTLPRCPPPLRALAERCAQAEPELRPANGSALVASLAPSATAGSRRSLPLAAAPVLLVLLVLALLTVLALVAWSSSEPDSDARSTRVGAALGSSVPSAALEQLTHNTEDVELRDAAVSPDGSRVAMLDVDGLSILRLADGHRRSIELPGGAPPRSFAWLDADRLLVASGSLASGSQASGSQASGSQASERQASERQASERQASERQASGIQAWELHLETGELRPHRLPEDARHVMLSAHGLVAFTADGWHAGPLDGPWRSLTLDGQVIVIGWSPSGTHLALIALRSDGTCTLGVREAEGANVEWIASDPRLVADSGTGGLAWASDDELLVALAPKPSTQTPPQLVLTPRSRWAPRVVHDLEHPASMISVDDEQRVVFAQTARQSDTMIMRRVGGRLEDLRRVSRSALDDRPTSWTLSRGLMGMMRVGSGHQVVRIPVEGGHPEPVGPGGWRTWPEQTDLGLLSFRPEPEHARVVLELTAPDSPTRTLATLPENLGAEGLGRAVPRSWAVGCSLDGRCLLADSKDGLRLQVLDARSGALRPLAAMEGSPRVVFDVAVDASFSLAAVSTELALRIVDLASGEVRQIFRSSADSVYQYVAADPLGGWYVSGMWTDAPAYRIVHIGSLGEGLEGHVTEGAPDRVSDATADHAEDSAGEESGAEDDSADDAADDAPRVLIGRNRTWLANPTPSPDGRLVAFSSMQFRADLYRVPLPARSSPESERAPTSTPVAEP